MSPAQNDPSFLRGTAVLIIWGTTDSSTDETALNAWWTNEHLPERLAIPGFQRTRRFYALDDSKSPAQSQYLVLYEVSSLATLTSKPYMAALNNPTPGTRKFMPVLASMNRSACHVLHSAVRPEFSSCAGGGTAATMAHLVFEAPADANRTRLKNWLVETAWSELTSHASPLALHILEHDDAATRSGSSTKSYDEVRFEESKGDSPGRWMVVIEFAEPFASPFGKYQELTQTLVEQLTKFDVGRVEARYFGLICMMNE